MSDISLEELTDFFTRYRDGIQGQAEQELESFRQDFVQLKGGFLTVQHAAMEEARLSAPGYNVFSVLGLSRSEVRTHSAMLAHLLNPQASHGQMSLFLRCFLEHCAQKYAGFPMPSDAVENGHWETLTELSTPYGRLDIVVRSPDLNFIFVIENKVDAGEQQDQLTRYGRWLAAHQQEYPSQALLYLSVHGQPAYTAGEFPYFRLSYRQDIPAWLERALPQIQAPNVLEVVRQYRSLVLSL
jgi:hypothetical protein